MPNKNMPNILKVALALLALSVVLGVVGGSWLGVVINVGLMIGVFRGNESIRRLLIGMSWLGLILNIVAGAISIVAFGSLSGLAIIGLVASIWGVAQCGYLIWCLNQGDVQQWMFNRSLKLV